MNKKANSYGNGGGFTSGAGDGDMTPAKAGMRAMAASGGLMGFLEGGSVIDPIMGQMKRGGQKKSKKGY